MRVGADSQSFWGCLLSSAIYKGAQGRLIRRIVLGVGIVVLAIFAQQVYLILGNEWGNARMAVPVAIFLLGSWTIARIVQFPPFVEFLIDVQLESTKVSWNTWPELKRTTTVVLVTMVAISAYLFLCDIVWQTILRLGRVLNVG